MIILSDLSQILEGNVTKNKDVKKWHLTILFGGDIKTRYRHI